MFYWILEFGKVMAAYLFIMYLWPSVVFRNYLKDKGMAFRFAFCATGMILLLNTVVLMLGLVGLLNPWLTGILFYGPLVYIFSDWLYRNREKAIYIKYLLTDICSFSRFAIEIGEAIQRGIRNAWQKLRSKIGPHMLLYVLLALAVIYGTVYFSYGAFHERYYGTSDVYVHHSWIDMLGEGRIFGAGVYPEGMHCFVYAMNTLFGVEVYSCLLFTGGIHISAFLISVYLFFKEIFPWKYTGIFVVVLYLILKLDSAAHIGGMARLQWTIPQEFAIFTVFLCGAYLLRFLRNTSAGTFRWKNLEFLRDENLLIFMMALAVSIAVHFYVTIMAFFLCLAIGAFFLVWVFTKKKALPLVIAIACGVLIAVTPMLAALASGMEFQDSIGWAMSVIENSQQAIENKENETTKPTVNPNWELDYTEPDVPEEELPVEEEPEPSLLEKFYDASFIVLYSEERAALLACGMLLGILIGLACHLTARNKRKEKLAEDPFSGYLMLISGAMTFMLLFAAPQLDMLELIQISRLGTMTHVLTIATVMIPLDLIMTQFHKRNGRMLVDVCAFVLCVAMCGCVVGMGEYHSYLYYVVTRYPAAAEISCKIIQEMKPDSFTIVSSVDELYQIKSYGFHEESVRFIHEMKSETYTLPTEYVFIFIEKKPLEYAQYCLLDGTPLLAYQEYRPALGENIGSQYPEVRHSEISEEWANRLMSIPQTYASYKNLTRRTIINSRMYAWAERFKELYPYQLTTVYEDDAFVCYMFRQNPARLLELAIMD